MYLCILHSVQVETYNDILNPKPGSNYIDEDVMNVMKDEESEEFEVVTDWSKSKLPLGWKVKFIKLLNRYY